MKKGVTILVFTILLITVMMWIASGPLARRVLSNSIRKWEKKGVRFHYDSISIHFLEKEAILKGVQIDWGRFSSIHAEEIHLTNLGLAALLKKRIQLHELFIDHPVIVYHEGDTLTVGGSSSSLKLNNVSVRGASMVYVSSSGDTLKIASNISVTGLQWPSPDDAIFEAAIADTVSLTSSFYNFSTNKINADLLEEKIDVDTISIEPRYPRAEFSQRKADDTDQLTATFHGISGRGAKVNVSGDPFFSVANLSVHFNLHVFKDKRQPERTQYKPLPQEFFKELFKFRIDTVSIVDSEVQYEEMGKEANASGTVSFEELNATIIGLSSDSMASKPVFDASAQLMDSGNVSISGDLSYTDAPSYLEGRLEGFPIGRLNDMLVPPTGIRVEQGTIDRLNFNFHYTNDRADGSVELSYRDLKIEVLKEDGASRNDLVSFVLNLFIENKKGKRVTGERNPGVISHTRDERKGIFNLWWKSVFSGIKSSFLDNKQMLSTALQKNENI